MQADLVLAGHSLRLVSSNQGILDGAAAVMMPPCRNGPYTGNGSSGWTIEVEIGSGARGSHDSHSGLPVVFWPQSGRRLVVHRSDSGIVEVTGTYRRGAAPAHIVADLWHRRTLVVLPPDDPQSRRWPDWLARSFFAARLLADGWSLLHASAVRVRTPAGHRAVLVLAGPRGGKSTLALRACREAGAALMADDLVLARAYPGGVEVIGWPARVAVPAELLSPALLAELPRARLVHSQMAGLRRCRVILSPPECEQILGIGRAGPALLGGIISVAPADSGQPAASPMTTAQVSKMIAAAAGIPVQRVLMSDLVDLTGAAPLARPACGAAELPVGGVPAIGIAVPDGSRLPVIPMWNLIGGRIPGLAARQ